MNTCVVLKVGGSLENRAIQVIADAIHFCSKEYTSVAIVHGGGPAISRALQDAGISLPFVNGHRATSRRAVSIVHRVLTQEVNPALVRSLQSYNLRAMGHEEGILYATGISGLQRTGTISRVDTNKLREQMVNGQVPILAPIAASDDDSLHYNVNADSVAASVAVALQASKLLFLTDVPGIYADWTTRRKLQTTTPRDLLQYMASGSFQAGMIPKVEAVTTALNSGVSSSYVVLGTESEAVLNALAHHPTEPWTSEFGTWIQNPHETCEGSEADGQIRATDAKLRGACITNGSRAGRLSL